MNVQFIGEPQWSAGSAVEVDARVDGRPITIVVTEEVLRTLSNELTSPRGVGDLFRRHANLFRDVIVDKIGLADAQRPDRLMILEADLHGRRY